MVPAIPLRLQVDRPTGGIRIDPKAITFDVRMVWAVRNYMIINNFLIGIPKRLTIEDAFNRASLDPKPGSGARRLMVRLGWQETLADRSK